MTIIGFLLKFMPDNQFIEIEKSYYTTVADRLIWFILFSTDCLPHHDHHRVPPQVHVCNRIHQKRREFYYTTFADRLILFILFSADCLPHHDPHRIPTEVHVRQPIHQKRREFYYTTVADRLISFTLFPQIVSLTMTIIGFLLKFMSDNQFIKLNPITQRLRTDLFYSFVFLQIVSLTMTIIGFLLKFMSDNQFIKIENFDYTTVADRLIWFIFSTDCVPYNDHHRIPSEVHVRQPIHKERRGYYENSNQIHDVNNEYRRPIRSGQLQVLFTCFAVIS